MEWFEQYWKWLFAIGNVFFVVVVWALSKQFARKDEHDKLAVQVEKLEQAVQAMPDSERLHKLELQMIGLSGELKGVSQLIKRFEHLSNLLLENELSGKKT